MSSDHPNTMSSTGGDAAAWTQAVFAALSFLATVFIGWMGYRLSVNQVKPLLYIYRDLGKDYTKLHLKNEGAGPARVTKVAYRLQANRKEQNGTSNDGWGTQVKHFGRRLTALLRAWLGRPQLLQTDLKEGWVVQNRGDVARDGDTLLLDFNRVMNEEDWRRRLNCTKVNRISGDLAEAVIANGKHTIIMEACFNFPNRKHQTCPSNLEGRQWRVALHHQLAGAEIAIDYEDVNGKRSDTHLFTFPPLTKGGEKVLVGADNFVHVCLMLHWLHPPEKRFALRDCAHHAIGSGCQLSVVTAMQLLHWCRRSSL